MSCLTLGWRIAGRKRLRTIARSFLHPFFFERPRQSPPRPSPPTRCVPFPTTTSCVTQTMSSLMSSLSGGRKRQQTPRKPSTTSNNHISRDPIRDRLSRIFDQYKGAKPFIVEVSDLYLQDAASSEDIINIEGTIRYFQEISLDPEEPAVFAVAYRLDAPSLGIITRTGFIEGWRSLG